MKPDWDKLAESYADSDVVVIADADCTADGKDVCSKVGVRGYPTIKYWLAGSDEAQDYKGGRSFDALNDFTKTTFAKPCDVTTQEHCSADEKAYLDSMKGKDVKKEGGEKKDALKKTEDDRKAKEKQNQADIKEFQEKEKKIKKEIFLLDQLMKSKKGHDEL